MPVLDHFHPPLYPGRHWESFHAAWISELGAFLNRVLPDGYFAETQVHLGGQIEVDVATFDRGQDEGSARADEGRVTTMVAERWAPPAPPMIWPSVFLDEFRVVVRGGAGDPYLVGTIELVSPANKDRPEARRAFAAKSASYLHEGIGLIVVDLVTSRLTNLHDSMVELLGLPARFRFAAGNPLYAVAYRPVRRGPGADQVEVWPVPLAVGGPLPVLPLGLLNGPTVPVDLDATYAEARSRSRL